VLCLYNFVFAVDLSQLHTLETEGSLSWSRVLALRMLYACLDLDPHSYPDYATFLERMDPNLRRQLQPIDVAR
jgi:hypothetical protein